ncbi:GNAT family N-acetyltransferase [uncultured Desulfobacter sp.]|uniref:GNAT family N-acetyltransferase n=1 Tax=uncultured Desulfobacter sp. TaxID=240139 RepID=UPI002AA747A1|nr:GNAT family N-acetyltransferase [uncultured Desulfobacter sp.]
MLQNNYNRPDIIKNFLAIKKITDIACFSCFTAIQAALKDVNDFYPQFDSWFYEKVVPGVINSERKILFGQVNGKVAGIAIIKNTSEKKISTVKVAEKFKGQRIGRQLFENSFEALDTEKPFCTISEEKLPEFKSTFAYYGFKLTSVHNGLYRDGKKEFFFNE